MSRLGKNSKKFLDRARSIHGDTYEYDLSKYVKSNIKIPITCKLHGIFHQQPRNHLSGQGCRKCKTILKAKRQTLSSEEFLSKVEEIHNGRYLYDKTIYINMRSSIIITCKEHGDFEQLAKYHIGGSGCPKCAVDQRVKLVSKSTEDFIKEAENKHGNRFSYELSEYTHCEGKITITCSEHGDFVTTPTLHMGLNGGCVRCFKDMSRTGSLSNTEEFINKAKLIHGDLYNYSKVEYVDSKTNVSILCNIHGIFKQTPSVHLNGSGCNVCAVGRRTRGNDEFIKLAKEVHGNRYIYKSTKYISSHEPVDIECRKHGIFSQEANSHLRGAGCPRCVESRGERMVGEVLEELGIEYFKEYVVDGYPYKYDFYLPEYNLFIEYHGIQHYQMVPYFHRDRNDFNGQLIRDKIKKEIVSIRKGRLIIIKYNFNNITKIRDVLLRKLKVYKVIR